MAGFSFSQTDQSATQAPQQIQFSPGGVSFGGSADGGAGGFTQGADGFPTWLKWVGVGATVLSLFVALRGLKKAKG